MNKTKQLVFASLCVALGLALPQAFHAIPNAGSILLPMHIPVLLCGFLCGPWYGLLVGALTPLLSFMITGMPPAVILPGMACELAVYGLAAGLLIRLIKTNSKPANIYISLLAAMIAGRLAAGLLNGLIFRAGAYSLQMWVAASFVTSLPGIAAQLVLIPLLVLTLEKAKLVSFS